MTFRSVICCSQTHIIQISKECLIFPSSQHFLMALGLYYLKSSCPFFLASFIWFTLDSPTLQSSSDHIISNPFLSTYPRSRSKINSAWLLINSQQLYQHIIYKSVVRTHISLTVRAFVTIGTNFSDEA